MKIQVKDGLPFVTVSLEYQDQRIELDNCLIDTGSAGTIFASDQLAKVGLQYEAEDSVHRIRGVGGSEFVFTKKVDHLTFDNITVRGFNVEVGGMDYGFEINGIIGMDFLVQVGAIIDLFQMEIYLATK